MLSRLDIINSMLAATGTQPLTGQDEQHPLYVKANTKLNEVSTSVQKLGMWFNTTVRDMNPGGDDQITLPSDTLRADPTDRSNNYTMRGSRLYDIGNHTFTIEDTVEVKLVRKLELRDLPQSALFYIKDKARYEFYLDEDGTEPKLSRYEKAMQVAWIELYREHLINRDTNYFDGNNAALFLKRGGGRRHRMPPYE